MAKKCPKCGSEMQISEEPRIAMGNIPTKRTRCWRCPNCHHIEKGGE
jgi:uncharacterized protein with PIN domain